MKAIIIFTILIALAGSQLGLTGANALESRNAQITQIIGE